MKVSSATRAIVVAAAVLGFAGCHHRYHDCKDIPHGAIPQPIGTHVCQWQTEQMARAEQDDFVIYRYEWLRDSAQFSPYGGRHMMGIAGRLPHAPFPVVIEPSDDATLDQARREAATRMLAELGMPDAADRVVIGAPEAEGLFGQEAPQVTEELFDTRGGGRRPASGFGGFRGGFRGALGGGIRAF